MRPWLSLCFVFAGGQRLLDVLFAVAEPYLDAEFSVEMFGQMLCGVDAAVLAACAAKRKHQVGKSAPQVACDVGVGQLIYVVEEGKYLAVVLKEFDDRSVQSREFFVGFVAARIVCAAAVEYIASAVAAFVVGDAFLVAEAEYAHDQRSFAIVG